MIYKFKDDIRFNISDNLLKEYNYLYKYELDKYLYNISEHLYNYLKKNKLLNNNDNTYEFNKIPKNEQYKILLLSYPLPVSNLRIYYEQ